jgi:hypothetical protein
MACRRSSVRARLAPSERRARKRGPFVVVGAGWNRPSRATFSGPLRRPHVLRARSRSEDDLGRPPSVAAGCRSSPTPPARPLHRWPEPTCRCSTRAHRTARPAQVVARGEAHARPHGVRREATRSAALYERLKRPDSFASEVMRFRTELVVERKGRRPGCLARADLLDGIHEPLEWRSCAGSSSARTVGPACRWRP